MQCCNLTGHVLHPLKSRIMTGCWPCCCLLTALQKKRLTFYFIYAYCSFTHLQSNSSMDLKIRFWPPDECEVCCTLSFNFDFVLYQLLGQISGSLLKIAPLCSPVRSYLSPSTIQCFTSSVWRVFESFMFVCLFVCLFFVLIIM